jgi:hypothetical protein
MLFLHFWRLGFYEVYVLVHAPAAEALDIFLSIVGAEAANMALRALATGGVYIAGGIFPKVTTRLWGGWVGGCRETLSALFSTPAVFQSDFC